MKKIFVAFCLLLSLFAVSVYAEEKIDKSLWWSSTADDPGLRRKFEELNRKYFNGTLKVKYIRYGHGLWKQDKLMSLTYYWGVNAVAEYAGCSVITIDDEYFVSHPDELESSLLTDMCRVYANMNDRNGNNDNVIPDELPSFKLMMDYLTKVGAKTWLSHKSVPVDSSTNNNTNQTSTKQSSQIAQTPQQNQKYITNTQQTKTITYPNSEQDEINQILAIFKSYEYIRTTGSWTEPPRQIWYNVYDFKGNKFELRFGARSDWKSWITIFPVNGDSEIKWPDVYNNDYRHYPVQEFLNAIRSDSRITVNGSNNSQKYVQGQNNQTSTKQSSQIVQTSQQNKKSFSNTQTVKTTTQTTNLRANPSSDFLYEFRDDNTNALKIIKYKGTSSTIVIPESIEGIPVTAITELDLNEKVRYNVYIPKSVNFIGGWIFSSIKGNISIDIENTTCFEGCFSNSDLLPEKLIVSKVTLKDPYHQQWLFSGNNITELIIKEGVTELPKWCFMDCKKLRSVTLPNSITDLNEAFLGCSSLTEINIPAGKKIHFGFRCFKGCTSLSMATRKKLVDAGYDGVFNE